MRALRGGDGRWQPAGAAWIAALLFGWVSIVSAAHVEPLERAGAESFHASHGRHTHGSIAHDHGLSCDPCKTLLGIALLPMAGVETLAPAVPPGGSDRFVAARERRSRDRAFVALPRGPPLEA